MSKAIHAQLKVGLLNAFCFVRNKPMGIGVFKLALFSTFVRFIHSGVLFLLYFAIIFAIFIASLFFPLTCNHGIDSFTQKRNQSQIHGVQNFFKSYSDFISSVDDNNIFTIFVSEEILNDAVISFRAYGRWTQRFPQSILLK